MGKEMAALAEAGPPRPVSRQPPAGGTAGTARGLRPAPAPGAGRGARLAPELITASTRHLATSSVPEEVSEPAAVPFDYNHLEFSLSN